MFKKFKDKLAEEVKSSPQRIQQFAQAAQAAVTSASSSISDITNSDLFSIGDNDNQHGHQSKAQKSSNPQDTFQDISLVQPSLLESTESADISNNHNIIENQRQRRLSNSSFASDVSFRLPSYESPSMYHLQSDMEVSASEAEERGFSSSTVSLDRVTKEQLYAAYRRTQERYTKYRTQYADLARHYKLLERENAKARSVLVETQDKALKRISELREQSSLEQSAKAHLEKALRMEIEERNMKIDTLNMKIKLLQESGDSNSEDHKDQVVNKIKLSNDSESEQAEPHLIDLSETTEPKSNNEIVVPEITVLNNKIEKLEQLVIKYKESLKNTKEKNSQLTAELQMLSKDLENKNKEIEKLQLTTTHLIESQQKIQELKDLNEELQNKINAYDFNKTKETSTLEIDLQKAQEEISQLRAKIEIYSKREEEYAISLAENKLSIHKELESKESEIKSLKENLATCKREVQSLNIVISDYKSSVSQLEDERSKLNNNINELNVSKNKIMEMEAQIKELSQKCQSLENMKSKSDEEYKCLQLQIKQETAEKLAMIDRNVYLENRNSQLCEENSKKSSQINSLESELQTVKKNLQRNEVKSEEESAEYNKLLQEVEMWKDKYYNLESEIQDEHEELDKLHSEIKKLLASHDLIQNENADLQNGVTELKEQNRKLQVEVSSLSKLKNGIHILAKKVKNLQTINQMSRKELQSLKHNTFKSIMDVNEHIQSFVMKAMNENSILQNNHKELKTSYNLHQKEILEVKENYEKALNDNHLLKIEMERRMKEHVLDQETIETIRKEHELTLNELNSLKNDNEHLTMKVHTTENELHSKDKDLTEQVKNNEQLIKELEERNRFLTELQDNISAQEQENIILKTQLENIVKNFKELETEFNNLRKSHTEIEVDKDRLNSMLENLQNNKEKLLSTKHSQTDASVEFDMSSNSDQENLNNQDNNKNIIEPENIKSNVSSQNAEHSELDVVEANRVNNVINICDTLSEEHSTLKINFDLLQKENKRLQSDIEGLQTYLTNVSKENSILNDKLRELIASGDNSPDKVNSDQVLHLKNDIQNEKDKVENLSRENTLLIEENLELKDQLKAQHYSGHVVNDSEKRQEYTALKEKYNNLLQAKSKLEKRITDLELSDRAVSGNVRQLQENNEKLRLSNEKLERRLDEALVSLRHLHSLKENTELEYLRNVLYEYLTGSGTHSITLAKVLSAVVKFDEGQTQLVLQKEKERQGLLHQLRII